MIAYIIFKNEEPIKVVLDDNKRALKKMLELEADDYYKNKHLYSSKHSYRTQYCWYLNEVEVIQKKENMPKILNEF